MASTTTSSTSSPSQSQARHNNPWSPQPSHANGHFDDGNSDTESQDETRSPSKIFLYTYTLAITLTASTILSSYLSSTSNPLWRLPFFLATLSLFHTLEYYITASYNPQGANTDAFLLTNGRAYNIAHCLAFMECLAHLSFLPARDATSVQRWWWTGSGLALVVAGQLVRTAAMATAGTNFNHIVQSQRKTGHVLVTTGFYRYLRHPTYFGFFWWGLGTQMVLGNLVCLVGYALVLWRFFHRRIRKEEEFLVAFFGKDYVRYRRRTKVGIPFIA